METSLLYLLVAALCSGIISFTTTPLTRVLAFKVNAIDDPKRDARRMHTVPIPRIGGLAIFAGFAVATICFCKISPTILAVLIGGFIIMLTGVIDDIFDLNPFVKLVCEIAAAVIPVFFGLTIKFINVFGYYLVFGPFEIPVTILWIIGLTNATNLIDGLDGLSCGVSAICACSLMLCSVFILDNYVLTVLAAILAGACVGFLPFNHNPAKIFMGDCGALFLGYVLSVISLDGLFKTHATISFIIPLLIFAIPLFDTVSAFFRRIFSGGNPFKGDKKHIHHRLIAMGFNQKQTVHILYALSALLGISAVMFSKANIWKAIFIIILAIAIFTATCVLVRDKKFRSYLGFDDMDNTNNTEETGNKDTDNIPKK